MTLMSQNPGSGPDSWRRSRRVRENAPRARSRPSVALCRRGRGSGSAARGVRGPHPSGRTRWPGPRHIGRPESRTRAAGGILHRDVAARASITIGPFGWTHTFSKVSSWSASRWRARAGHGAGTRERAHEDPFDEVQGIVGSEVHHVGEHDESLLDATAVDACAEDANMERRVCADYDWRESERQVAR